MADAWQVIVEREPEWDDETVKRAEALGEYEASLCNGCNNPLEDTLDKSTYWKVQDETCMACRAKDLVERDFATKHEDDKPQRGVPMASDGRKFFVLPHQPEEVSTDA